MGIFAGTALLAFGGHISAQRSRGARAVVCVARLLCLGAMVQLLPTVATPCIIGCGWLLSLTARLGDAGWDVFAAGCAAYGHGLLLAAGIPHCALVSWLLWLVGWTLLLRGARRPMTGGQSLRWELARARRWARQGGNADAWRIRACDAVERANIALQRLAPRPGKNRGGMTPAVTFIGVGAAALADGDAVIARDEFEKARKALVTLAGTGVDGREELGLWLELIGWCDLAATLIDEEDLN